MKRFYKVVSHEQTTEGFTVFLDGRVVKTKTGASLLAPNEDIANKVVQEWVNQESIIDPETMLFTQILNTKIDQVSKKRGVMSAAILKYLDTDLLCYLASHPQELVRLQENEWKKWRIWMEQEFGDPIKTTTGLTSLSQPKALIGRAGARIGALNDDLFTLLQIVVPLSGSLILGLAMVSGQASAQNIFDACFVEEQFKGSLYDAEKYGVDPHTEEEQASIMRDLKACESYLRLIS